MNFGVTKRMLAGDFLCQIVQLKIQQINWLISIIDWLNELVTAVIGLRKTLAGVIRSTRIKYDLHSQNYKSYELV
jgi:hypothetical protein